MKSYIQRFIFDKLPLRGAFVVLEDTWQTIAAQREYSEGVRQFLGELLVANVLLTANIKLSGKIVTQIQDNPKLDLAVSECTHNLCVRATAKFTKSSSSDYQIQYEDCLNGGMLVISVDSQNEGKLYQSIVALTSRELSHALNDYMLQSEQLRTFFMFAYTNNKVVGFMLQQLPDPASVHMEESLRVFALAATLTKAELQHKAIEVMLQQLFHEDDIILSDPDDVRFACTCSREKVTNMLRSLGKEEAESIIADEGSIQITCDFCNSVYVYDSTDIVMIFESLCADMESASREIH